MAFFLAATKGLSINPASLSIALKMLLLVVSISNPMLPSSDCIVRFKFFLPCGSKIADLSSCKDCTRFKSLSTSSSERLERSPLNDNCDNILGSLPRRSLAMAAIDCKVTGSPDISPPMLYIACFRVLMRQI